MTRAGELGRPEGRAGGGFCGRGMCYPSLGGVDQLDQGGRRVDGGCRARTGGRGLMCWCRFAEGEGGKRGQGRRGGNWAMKEVVVDGGEADPDSISEVDIGIC